MPFESKIIETPAFLNTRQFVCDASFVESRANTRSASSPELHHVEHIGVERGSTTHIAAAKPLSFSSASYIHLERIGLHMPIRILHVHECRRRISIREILYVRGNGFCFVGGRAVKLSCNFDGTRRTSMRFCGIKSFTGTLVEHEPTPKALYIYFSRTTSGGNLHRDRFWGEQLEITCWKLGGCTRRYGIIVIFRYAHSGTSGIVRTWGTSRWAGRVEQRIRRSRKFAPAFQTSNFYHCSATVAYRKRVIFRREQLEFACRKIRRSMKSNAFSGGNRCAARRCCGRKTTLPASYHVPFLECSIRAALKHVSTRKALDSNVFCRTE